MLTIEWEPLSRLIADGLEDMAALHWEEAETDREAVPLELDFERAQVFEKIEQFKIAGLRKRHVLIGYAAFTIMPAMFHRTTRHAFCNALYVDPDHRGPASLALVWWAEKALTALGVKKLYMTAKADGQCDLFLKLGYALSETVYSKLLGDRHGQQQPRSDTLSAA